VSFLLLDHVGSDSVSIVREVWRQRSSIVSVPVADDAVLAMSKLLQHLDNAQVHD